VLPIWHSRFVKMLILLIFIANRRVDVKAKGVTFNGLDTSKIFYQNSEGNKSKFFVPHELRRISPHRQASK
jgi:hypothetical protein